MRHQNQYILTESFSVSQSSYSVPEVGTFTGAGNLIPRRIYNVHWAVISARAHTATPCVWPTIDHVVFPCRSSERKALLVRAVQCYIHMYPLPVLVGMLSVQDAENLQLQFPASAYICACLYISVINVVHVGSQKLVPCCSDMRNLK
jgi:hypothetical protein